MRRHPDDAIEQASQGEEGVDVEANRLARKWSRGETLKRAAWEVLAPLLFRLSPRPLWAWRRGVLRLFGAEVGYQVHVHPTARIAIPWNLAIGDQSAIGDRALIYSLGQIVIGRRVTISQGAHLCAGSHDYSQQDFPLLKVPITIGDGAWICADAFVGPGVKIGSGAIVGARAVAMKDVPSGLIVAGNPARTIGARR